MSFFTFLTLFLHFIIYNKSEYKKSNVLNDYIRHYEGLSYDVRIVEATHQRNKRSTTTTNEQLPLRIKFYSHGRNFPLRLTKDTTTFHKNVKSLQPDGSLRPLDVSHIYQGVLEDEPNSYVHGSVINGIFAGRIESKSLGTFYIEKSEIYFKEPVSFHSVIYNEDDVVHPKIRRRKRSVDEFTNETQTNSSDDNSHDADDVDDERKDNHMNVGCGLSHTDVHDWMNKIQNSAVPSNQNKKNSDDDSNNKNAQNNDYNFFKHRYHSHSNQYNSLNNKKKRSTNNTRDNRLCALFLQSDPVLWDYMTRSPNERYHGGLGYSPERAREEITSLFASHVDGIKKIYSNTIFKYQDVGPYTGFTFAVHRVQINTSDECEQQQHQPPTNHNTNPFCKWNVDVSYFLNLNSLANHDLFCLAYVFTYRDFSHGTLGLAWVGSYLRASGGLCERYKQYNENHRMVYKSLNTGIVTLVNYGSRVPLKVSTLTFAHEVGHNFGSPHDYGESCIPSLHQPNNLHGNYIMFASATSGDKPNNHEFSACSINNITLVLEAVLNEQNGKDNCFSQSEEAFCGNGMVEDGEECDCGFASDCLSPQQPDRCCHERESSKHCTRKANATCSPSEGPCCLGDRCNYIQSTPPIVCMQEHECSQTSYCNGLSAKCPPPTPKPDFTLCNFKTQICKNGDCSGSVCEMVSWSMCSLEAPREDRTFDRRQLCYVACLNPTTSTCISTGSMKDVWRPANKQLYDLLLKINMTDDGILLPAGAPCDNYRGYCDVFHKCRAVDEEGVLFRLMFLVFNGKTINKIKTWILEKWWAVPSIGLSVVLVMGVFIKCCAVHTPSSNPRQPPARKLTLPRRHIQRPQPFNPQQIPLGPPPPYTPTPPSVQPRLQPQQGKRRQSPSSRHHGNSSNNNNNRQPQRCRRI